MLVLGIILIVLAIALVVAVLMQNGKDHNLSGTIAGAAESFFGKTKGSTVDKKLSTATTVIAVVFVVLVLVAFLAQGRLGKSDDTDVPAATGAPAIETTVNTEDTTEASAPAETEGATETAPAETAPATEAAE